MKIMVIANLNAASTISVKDLREKFSVYEANTHIIPFTEHYKHDITSAIKDGATTIVAAGGDGTVNAVVNEIATTRVALGVLPLGTLNHFAKDNHIPLELDKAIACIIKAKTKKIDVGMVNHHIFVNNSSIGIYPRFIHEREKHQSLLTKWGAALIAAIKIAISMRNQHVSLRVDGKKTLKRKTPFVFIGNNIYDPSKQRVTSRQSLDAGVLGIHILKTRNIFAIIRIMAQLFTSRRPSHHDFESLTAHKITITSKKSMLHVAIDGETIKLATPLHYISHHKKLPIIVP